MEAAVVGAVVGTTIKVVLDNLLSFSVEEIGLLYDFKKDLQKLKQSVGTIRDFLDDAEMKQVTDKPVQRWLHKLEALAFDADYVFDELNYQVLRKKVKADKKMKKKVSSLFSTSNHISFRHEIGKKIKHVKKELKLINKEASELGLQIRFSGAHAHGAETEALVYLETDSFSVDPIFVGRENDVKKIVNFLISTAIHEHVISVLPIVGMGGLGKTTLATKVYNNYIITSHFEERIWVHVSANFDPVIVLRKTLESLIGEKVDGSREVVLIKTEKRLKGKRYLLVLDNVWNDNNDKWDNFVTSLRGISSVKGNVIIITTRMGSVASIVKTHDVHELGGLSKEDCWSIIKAKAFGLGEGVPSEFDTIGKKIARRCGGLPLAAKVAGGLLRGKSKDEWDSTEDKWLSDFGEDGDIVRKILKLSYDNLLSPSVKKCFAFCSIIPKGFQSIEKDEMIHLWMAEGLLQSDREKDMAIVGNKVFKLLEQSSLLQVCRRDNFGNVEGFAIHELVHDLALSVLNPEFLDNNYQARYLSRPYIDELSPTALEEHAKSLRALYLNGKVSHIRLSNFKCLHVLILDDEDIKELPAEIGKLISLRLLDISYTRVEYLPDSTGDLYHLQTLRATKDYGGEGYLRKLPDTFKSLISLRHLCIPNIKLPPEIGKLVSLRSLPYFQVDEEEGCGIVELGRLKNLRGEIEIHNLEKVSDKEDAKSADLFHKPDIFKLKLMWNVSGKAESRNNDENVLEGLQPHPNLKSLEINGFKGRHFSLWTKRMEVREELDSHWVRLDNLVEIKLSSCEECEEIPMLGKLPHLKWLYLHGLSNVKCMGSLFYGIDENGIYKETVNVFPALEKLELIGMKNLSAWDGVEFETPPRQVSLFARLEYLTITDCRQLVRGPSDFPCLKELEIENMESGLPLEKIAGSKLTSLTKLMIKSVDGLECLPDRLFYNNRDLIELEIRNCNNLTRLVPCLEGGGSSLRKLRIHSCLSLKELPEDLHSLNALEMLMISSCQNLKSIAYNPQGYGGGGGCGFTSLHTLQVAFCNSVTNLPIQMIESCALSLESFQLTGSKSIKNLPQVMSILAKMPRLNVLNIQQVPKFTDVVVETGSFRSLVYLGIGGSSDCRDYVSFKMSLDRFFPTILQSLHMLVMHGMEHWDVLPDQLQHLTILHQLKLVDFGIEELPEWLGNLSYLRILRLHNCQKIRHLASKKVMQGLTRLTKLYINKCPLLKHNLEVEASDDDSEWSKISHITTIIVDSQPFSAHAQ